MWRRGSVWLTVVAMVVVAVVVVEAAKLPAWRMSRGLRVGLRGAGVGREDNPKWCDDVLGCLELNDDWYSSSRPINVLPATRKHINTTFMLHTRANPALHENVYITADKDSIDGSTFDPSKPVKFVVHGFIDTGYLKWLRQMAEAYLNYGDFNVIRVDWGGGSLPMYFSATANTRVVGLEIAHLVNFLTAEYGVDPANVHVTGHSLGSHISGYAGEAIEGLGRITGMDPAGPYFTETATFVRLDPTDAVFVDCIHTDADSILMLGYGTTQTMGNLDFYPNSGRDQPGCDPVSIGIESITDIGDGVRDLAACSHARSYKLYTDVMNQPCPYIAHECNDYESFHLGRCATCGDDNTKCAYMGIRAEEYVDRERVNVQLYLDTDKSEPFCYYHYQLIVDTAHPREAEDWVQGLIKITVYGDNGEVLENYKLTDKHEKFEHGQPKYFLFTSHIDLSRAVTVSVAWEYDDSLTNPGSYCWDLLCNRALYLKSFVISPMDYYPEEVRKDHRRVLCHPGEDTVKIEDEEEKNLEWDESCHSDFH